MNEGIKPEFVTLDDAAVMLSLSRRTIEKWVLLKKISVVHLGRAVRIPISEIERLVNQDALPKGK